MSGCMRHDLVDCCAAESMVKRVMLCTHRLHDDVAVHACGCTRRGERIWRARSASTCHCEPQPPRPVPRRTGGVGRDDEVVLELEGRVRTVDERHLGQGVRHAHDSDCVADEGVRARAAAPAINVRVAAADAGGWWTSARPTLVLPTRRAPVDVEAHVLAGAGGKA